MPKISDLDAGVTLVGNELLPAVQSGQTVRVTPAQIATYVGATALAIIDLGLGLFNVKDYGAIGDGVTNDTAAIQAAIDAAKTAGGGLVWIPAGEYKVQPSVAADGFGTGGYALRFTEAYTNITIMGAGPTLSKLVFYVYGGLDPATNWEVVQGSVSRGNIITFQATSSITQEISDITISNLELDGNAPPTGAHNIPPSLIDGTGWDVTHHGVGFYPGQTASNIIIENCYLHDFRGEIISYSGGNLASIYVRNCRIARTEADGISMTADLAEISGCEIYDCYQGVENAFGDGFNVYRDNYLHDCEHGGFHVYPVSNGSVGFAEIYNNRLQTITLALLAPGARNMRIFNNIFVDCASYNIQLTTPGGGGSGNDTIQINNVEIFNNTFVQDQLGSAVYGIILYTSDPTYAARYLHIHDNLLTRSADAVLDSRFAGAIMSVDVSQVSAGVRFERNLAFGGGDDDDSLAHFRFPVTLTSGAEQTFGTLLHFIFAVARVDIWYYVLINCTLTFRMEWIKEDLSVGSRVLFTGAVTAGTYAHVHDGTQSYGFGAGYSQVKIYYTVTVATAVKASLSITRF